MLIHLSKALFLLSLLLFGTSACSRDRLDDSPRESALVLFYAGASAIEYPWSTIMPNINWAWTSEVNDNVSWKANNMIGFFVSIPVFVIESALNFGMFAIALAMTLLGFLLLVLGILVIPVLWIWNVVF